MMKNVPAVICDVYRTLLEVGESPPDADERWTRLLSRLPRRVPPISLEELSEQCRGVVIQDHEQARARGVAYPEVDWPTVMERALPALCELPPSLREDFIFEHMQLLRTLHLMQGAAEFLQACRRHGMILGIASNAQAYTLRELTGALAGHGLDFSIFAEDLIFWSFENGFSKPDRQVYRILAERLARRGISPDAAMMVGDRLDNDIEPARELGWQTWWLVDAEAGEDCGSWEELRKAMFSGRSLDP